MVVTIDAAAAADDDNCLARGVELTKGDGIGAVWCLRTRVR